MSAEQVYEGRAFRDGQWLPWHSISATVFENRRNFPRDGYQVRYRIAAPSAQATTNTEG